MAFALLVSALTLPAGAAARSSEAVLLVQFGNGRAATVSASGGLVHQLGVGFDRVVVA